MIGIASCPWHHLHCFGIIWTVLVNLYLSGPLCIHLRIQLQFLIICWHHIRGVIRTASLASHHVHGIICTGLVNLCLGAPYSAPPMAVLVCEAEFSFAPFPFQRFIACLWVYMPDPTSAWPQRYALADGELSLGTRQHKIGPRPRPINCDYGHLSSLVMLAAEWHV